MKWAEVIALIDPKVREAGAHYLSPVWESDVQVFAEALEVDGLFWSEEFSKRMLKHWVQSWICTDTRVGLAVYCLDGEVVAVSYQPARKSDEVLLFRSNYHAEYVRTWLRSLADTQLPPQYLVYALEAEVPDYSMAKGNNWWFQRGTEGVDNAEA